MKTLLNYLLNKRWILSIIMCFLNEGVKEKIYIARLRSEFIFWGHDVTDEEIKEGIKNVAKTIGSFGATAEEAEKAVRVLGNCK